MLVARLGRRSLALPSFALPRFDRTTFHLSNLSCPLMVCVLMKVHVIVMPKQSVLDPQGVAVRNALKDVGLETVESVRVGKFLELEFKTPPAEMKLEEICHDLLSNPVIEDYRIQYHSTAEASE
jgi:phosphoribosylformylglycinamidine synthase subunit PurS